MVNIYNTNDVFVSKNTNPFVLCSLPKAQMSESFSQNGSNSSVGELVRPCSGTL